MKNRERIEAFVRENGELAYAWLKELTLIPAPSWHEEKRAAWCVEKFKSFGYENAYVDEALNAVCPLNCDGSDKLTVLCAHTDTVFPLETPLPYEEKDGKIFCPGVGDDTAGAISILLTAKYFAENKIVPENGLLLVCNAGEESVGDLKGTRCLLKAYANRVSRFLSVDSSLDGFHDTCVGGYKCEVTAKVQGGHAFGNFGRKNAIAVLAQIVTELYKIELPKEEGTVYSYNVGVIEGGKSVNAIAQEARMHCEYRSNKPACRKILEEKFNAILDSVRADDVEISVRTLSDRPCSQLTDFAAQNALVSTCAAIYQEVLQKPVRYSSASTDCNLPLSLGIPALAIGTVEMYEVHTTEEWIDKASFLIGLRAVLAVAEAMSEK